MKTKGKIQDIYPLTSMQEGMLFHSIYEKNSSLYFVQASYRLHGELNVSYVKKSLNELLKRYDILRTVFIYEGRERPLQIVLKEREIDFCFEDIRKIVGKDTQKIDAYVEQSRKKDRQRSFDLSKDVLMRVSILQVGDSEYEFIWSHHHILMDGWCKGILVLEFLEIYNSYLENRPRRLPKAKQFKIYIQWLEKQDKDEAKNYWKRYLENYEKPAAIPFKLFNNNDLTYELEEICLELDGEKSYALNELAARNQITLNTLIQVIWGIILGKYNDNNDVVYGSVVSGRPSQLEGIESLIGIFINTIPVRIRWMANTKFNELLQRVQEEAINCEPYHHCPLVKIQAESTLKRNLFDHVIVFENYPVAEQLGEYNIDNGQKKKLELSNVEFSAPGNYNFTLILEESDRIWIKFQYNANLYDRDYVKRIPSHFCHMIDQIINNGRLNIESLTLLSDEEKNRILFEFIDKQAEYPKDKTINPAEKREYYKLSPAQKRLYRLHQIDPGTRAYNIPEIVRVEGNLDRERFGGTARQLIARHESLRISFHVINDEPVQRVHEKVEFKIKYYDDDPAPNDQSIEEILNGSLEPFSLEQAPLMRVGMIQLEEKNCILMIDMHYIISDDVSAQICVKEFAELFAGKELPRLRLQYKDYSQWHNLWVESAEFQKQEQYWLNRFKGDIPVLNIPLNYSRPKARSYEGDTVNVLIEGNIMRELERLMNKTGTTLYMILLALCNLLLYKYTGQEDIIIGSVTTGRNHIGLENIIGFFINMHAVRNRVKGEQLFVEFLNEVKKNIIAALDHQDYPFDELVSKLGIKREPSRYPLVDVVFQLQNIPFKQVEVTQLQISPYQYKHNLARFDLYFEIFEIQNAVSINIQYAASLFTRTAVENMAKNYLYILNQALANENIRLEQIKILPGLSIAVSNPLQEDHGDFGF